MANQNNHKNKGKMSSGDEVPLQGRNGRNASRKLLRGDLCRGHVGRVDMNRTMLVQRAPPIRMFRHGANREVIALTFPVNMEARVSEVVELDLSKERTTMRTSWIVVGLFFPGQPFSSEGLFKELKSKWGLRGCLNYTPL